MEISIPQNSMRFAVSPVMSAMLHYKVNSGASVLHVMN